MVQQTCRGVTKSSVLSYERKLQCRSMFGDMHVLNIVVTEATSVVVTSASLFSLLNVIAVFFRESYQRMKVLSRHSTVKQMETTGQTRWWSKDDTLKKVLGSFNNPTAAFFMEAITTLNAILIADRIQAALKANVKGYIESPEV